MYNSVFLLFTSNTIYLMFVCFCVTIMLTLKELNLKSLMGKFLNKSKSDKISSQQRKNQQSELKEAPGPMQYPIIGNLPEMGKYEVPYQAFTHLAEQYGPIVKLQLGSVPTLVVNGIENIKEVLITKGSHFDSRPNFKRYHKLFSGNKENCKYQSSDDSFKIKSMGFLKDFSKLINKSTNLFQFYLINSFGIL